MATTVPPELNQDRPGRVLVVGRDPGGHEMEEGRPFVGVAGQLLDMALSEAGFRRSEINITNVVPTQPFDNDFSKHDPYHVEQGMKDLSTLIARLKPSLIIALGNEAAYATIEGWPTRGRGIFGAKDITERRGYFWNYHDTPVIATLHPAGVLRKAVPGRYLIGRDFTRARLFLDGHLQRETPPAVKRLNSYMIVSSLVQSKLVAWDIETKWDMNSLLWCGFCGDDLQPYAAYYPKEFRMFAVPVLLSTVPKVGHNVKFDLSTVELLEQIEVKGVNDDTQQMWWALEPEFAGDDDTDGDESGILGGGHRMTRKGLAFLASLNWNVEWWKNYPKPDDPQHDEKMFVLNGKDTWATRRLASELGARMENEQVVAQYRQAMEALPALLDMHREGLPINDKLRLQRIEILDARSKSGSVITKENALDYILKNEVPQFRKMKKCTCCGGGKVAAQHCWRCGGLPKKPTKKEDYRDDKGVIYCSPFDSGNVVWDITWKRGIKVGELKAALPPCTKCINGKVAHYDFNPFSPPQLKKLLYDVIGLPRHTFRGKEMMDEDAMKKILRWAKT